MNTTTPETQMLAVMLNAVEFGFKQAEQGHNLLRAKAEYCRIWQGQDPHRRKAAEMFNVPYDKVTPAQRRAAKSATFGDLYGVKGTNVFKVQGRK